MLDGSPLIDVHHHFIPKSLFAELRAQAGGAARLVNDVVSITLNPTLCDVDVHLETMRAAGVDAALLTYSALSVLGRAVCRSLNDALGELQSSHPGVLFGAVHVDIQDPPSAVRELDRGVNELGLRVVALPTSAGAVELDDTSLGPLWDKIDELGLAVVLHPASLPKGASTDHGLERSCARPFDTTTALVRMIEGVLPDHPELRVVAPHAGGTAPYLKGRIEMFFTPRDKTPRSLPRTQHELHADGLDEVFERSWRQIYVDTAGNGGWAPVTKAALEILSSDRVCFGSDFPLESHDAATMTELVDTLGSLGLEGSDLAAVACDNAASLLGIADPHLSGAPAG